MTGDLSHIADWLVRVADYPLGWLLALPRDLAILLLAFGTSLLLTLVRRWTTNQDRLRRCRNDVRRLRQLIREAKREKDAETARRMRTTLAQVRGLRLRAEGKPLLVSLVPILLLAVWAVARLDYLPPPTGQDLTIRAYYPLSSLGKLTHLVPPEATEMRGTAVQLVRVDPQGQAHGLASWILHPRERADSLDLVIRHQGQTATHRVRIGGRTYAPPVVAHEGGRILATETVLRQARFLGIVPGIPAVRFPPWLVAYLILVIPLVPALRRALRVY